ncbi:MAG TPA: phytanoyl-CoA dioxygenase family protein [Acidimicrobiales bacterium]|nr:phytanoyl-CoA dioxygenase family protein [Acidimicrobiales bacterium]
MLTDDQRRQFATDGFVLVPGVVDEALLRAADAEVDELVAGSPAPAGTVGPHFYFLPPDQLPAADTALRDSGALALADTLVAPHHLDHASAHVQAALNIPPYLHRPGAPHIDGHRPDKDIDSFTMLAAIFLSDESAPDRGNLWVWPGSHRGHGQLFREQGVDVLKAVSGHAIILDPPVWFGPGEPLLAGRGDLLLSHFLLGHNIGGNTSDTTRRILYYRLAAEGHADRWTDTFLDPLTEYPSLRGIAPTEPFTPATT